MGTASSEGQLPARSLMMILIKMMKRMETASSERHLPARSLMMMMILMKMMKVASSGRHLLLFGQSLNNNFGCVQILTDVWEGEQEDFINRIEYASLDMRR